MYRPVESTVLNLPEKSQLEAWESRLVLKSTGPRAEAGFQIANQRFQSGICFWIKDSIEANELTKHSILGTFRIRSVRIDLRLDSQNDQHDWQENPQSESQTSISIRPAQWLNYFGIGNGFQFDFANSSIHGWKHTLSLFRVVPDDASIFKLCQEGNLSAVQSLLSTGSASARDTDTRGLTPLHVREQHLHPNLG